VEIEVLKFEEAQASTLPDLGEDIEVDAALWRRLESYICQRFTPRQCVWIVKGPGEFAAHLSPLSGVTVDQWDDITFTWSSVICEPSPLSGFYLPRTATYRITGTVGAGTVPAIVAEAYKRLRDYHADESAGASQYSTTLGENGIQESIERAPTWIARALQNSGAADLLRGYHRCA
jgi:hypothetical protein